MIYWQISHSEKTNKLSRSKEIEGICNNYRHERKGGLFLNPVGLFHPVLITVSGAVLNACIYSFMERRGKIFMRFLSVVFKLCNSLQLTRFQIKVGAKRFLVCDKKEDKQATNT